MKYPKIKSLFQRDKEFKFTNRLISESLQDLQDIKWVCLEKLDGMNIRIICDFEKEEFKCLGRTDEAVIPTHLKEELDKILTCIKAEKQQFLTSFSKIKKLILYGEGFGFKIQKGGLYLKDKVAFNLFDCYCFMSERETGFWMNEPQIKSLSQIFKLSKVPELPPATLHEAEKLVRTGLNSHYGTAKAEGVIIKTKYPLFNSFGMRMIFKLKTKDFNNS